jgi:sugar/nucleoside kinase (ribokinase family)
VSPDRSPRILGVGIACLDYLFVAPRPAPGGQAELRERLIQGGGLIGTALVAAARLGASAVIWTWVGEDVEGEQVAAGLREEGVDTRHVAVIAGARTPVSFIHVEEGSGERTIYHGPRLPLPAASLRKLDHHLLACDVLLVDGVWPEASRRVAARARQQAVPVVGDFCPGPELAELAREVTALIVPSGCADRLAPATSREEQLRLLARGGPRFVAITAGEQGCYYLDEGGAAHQPGFSIPVVDTTGAGDVFHGAFAYALARQWSHSRAVEFASAAAALSCRALGGRTAAPTLEETLRLLREQGSSCWREGGDRR